MSAAQVIDEIKHLSPAEQSKVVNFAFELARTRQLTGDELRKLAEELANATDLAGITRLRSALTRGFYGD